MAATGKTFSIKGASALSKLLGGEDGTGGMIGRVRDRKVAMQAAADYMVRSTKLRITRDKRGPDGEAWEPLSEATLELRRRILGNTSTSQLFVFGDLSRSITARAVTQRGFEIRAEADYASFQQKGVKRTGGIIKGKTIPKRPFLGFSETNIRRIRKIMNDFILKGQP